MKRFIIFIIATILLVVVTISCNKKDFYNETLKTDYIAFIEKHPNGVFYESDIVLDKNIESVASYKDITVIGCDNIFQDSTFCYIFTHNFKTGTISINIIEDFWTGSNAIDPNKLHLTLTKALKLYWKQDDKTTGSKIVLRSPVSVSHFNPLYIIGQFNSPFFISIDTITNEVKRFK